MHRKNSNLNHALLQVCLIPTGAGMSSPAILFSGLIRGIISDLTVLQIMMIVMNKLWYDQ